MKTCALLLALLFAGELFGETLDIMGDFKQWNPAGNLPSGWFAVSKNVKCSSLPAETKDGKLLAHVQAGKEEAILCTRKLIPVESGNIIVITAELRGTGSAGAKVFLYDASKKYIATLTNGFNAREQFKTGKWTFQIGSEYGKEKKTAPAFCRIAFFAGVNSDIVFRQISAELKAQKK